MSKTSYSSSNEVLFHGRWPLVLLSTFDGTTNEGSDIESFGEVRSETSDVVVGETPDLVTADLADH